MWTSDRFCLSVYWKGCTRNFKWPSMQRRGCTIYNDQLKNPVCTAYSLNLTQRTAEFSADHTSEFRYMYTHITSLSSTNTVVNRAFPSLHGGSPEITLNSPFKLELWRALHQVCPVHIRVHFRINIYNLISWNIKIGRRLEGRLDFL